MTQGTIIRVAGPVVDVQFTEGKLPCDAALVLLHLLLNPSF